MSENLVKNNKEFCITVGTTKHYKYILSGFKTNGDDLRKVVSDMQGFIREYYSTNKTIKENIIFFGDLVQFEHKLRDADFVDLFSIISPADALNNLRYTHYLTLIKGKNE